jgi:hypothetical protein
MALGAIQAATQRHIEKIPPQKKSSSFRSGMPIRPVNAAGAQFACGSPKRHDAWIEAFFALQPSAFGLNR